MTAAAMYDIEISDSQTHVVLEDAFVSEVVEWTLRAEGVASAKISVALIDNAAIRSLHRQFLNRDSDTDVLSFLLDSDDALRDEQSAAQESGRNGRGRGKRIDGEIVVSAEMAAATAAEFDWSPRDEVVLYLVHGLLHLIGYEDDTVEERNLMRTRERAVLARWSLNPRYAEEDDAVGPHRAGRSSVSRKNRE